MTRVAVRALLTGSVAALLLSGRVFTQAPSSPQAPAAAPAAASQPRDATDTTLAPGSTGLTVQEVPAAQAPSTPAPA